MKVTQGFRTAAFFAFFPILSAGAAAQDISVTTGEAPFILNGAVNKFASITISENSPDVLQDGYILLYFMENPDQRVTFHASSSAAGAIAGPPTVTGGSGLSALLIEVDATDGSLDSIVVEPYAEVSFYDEFYSFRNSPIGIQLGDDPTIHALFPPGEGAGLGSAAGVYPLGLFGGSGGMAIGEAAQLTLLAGETVTLDLDHSHPAHVIVESFNPAVASVESHTLTQVEIRGNAPGEALIQGWNPIGESGYLSVTVQDPILAFLARIEFLIDEIQALVPENLRHGRARALQAGLRRAARALEGDDPGAACRHLDAFVSAVDALLRANRLDPVTAGELLAEAALIRAGLGCS